MTGLEKTMLKLDDKKDMVEEPLLLTEESKKNHQEKPTFVEEPVNKDIECPYQECAELENMWATPYDFEQIMSQDGSKVYQNHLGMHSRRCLQFEEAAPNPFGSINNNPLPAHVPQYSISSATSSNSPSFIEPSNLFIHFEHPASVHNLGQLSSIGYGNFEGSYQTSPENKKMKTPSTPADDKRCNCKKSKCLKLYCDCFAAGLYCHNHCRCQSCCNREEYDDLVDEIKEEIESRNPLAFAPRIVQRATDCPSNNVEDFNLTTSSSARHRRGCSCKKSTCLKKYCECYQANVGCSGACRCVGCKNIFGRNY